MHACTVGGAKTPW